MTFIDMHVDIRLASLNDVKGITEVHCSDVKVWRKRINDKWCPASYEELSIEERFMHGGPWMSVETCAIYLNYLLIAKQYPLVAVLDDKIVGELELFIGEERGVLGKTAFIDILVVHNDYRRRGIGRRLVQRAEEMAVENNCDTLSVWPEENAIPFYNKCGITVKAYEPVEIAIKLDNLSPEGSRQVDITIDEVKYSELEKMFFISPRIYSSKAAWLKSKWTIAIKEWYGKTIRGWIYGAKAYFVLREKAERSAVLFMWIKSIKDLGEVLKNILYIAKRENLSEVTMIIDQKLAKKLEQKILLNYKNKYTVLYKNLK